MAKQQDVLVDQEPFQTRQGQQPVASQGQAQQQSNEPREMPRFTATRTVRAVKLGAVDRNPDGTVVLVPEDSAFAKVQLGPNEAANVKGFGPSDTNKDYGYAVIGDDGRREWMSSADFNALYGDNNKK